MAIGTQAALNIGVVTVVLPTKGLPLPFVSAGGTSMLLTAAAVGVLLNIAKQIVPKSEMVVTSALATTCEQRQFQIIEHEQTLASLEEQATELSNAGEHFEQEIVECQQAIEQPTLELMTVKKQLKRDAGEPLETQELEELSAMAKRLAQK